MNNNKNKNKYLLLISGIITTLSIGTGYLYYKKIWPFSKKDNNSVNLNTEVNFVDCSGCAFVNCENENYYLSSDILPNNNESSDSESDDSESDDYVDENKEDILDSSGCLNENNDYFFDCSGNTFEKY